MAYKGKELGCSLQSAQLDGRYWDVGTKDDRSLSIVDMV
jgi:hypothetical protein